jgi:hypothetical protein
MDAQRDLSHTVAMGSASEDVARLSELVLLITKEI